MRIFGPRPDDFSLDRINPHGNYEPGNLRWSDAKTQVNNIRDPEGRGRKISEANKGRKLPPRSEEHRRKMSEARKGRTLSEDHRRKMSAARKGKPSPNKGKTLSPEHRAKIGAASKGIPKSEATRAKIGAASKAYWAKKKAEQL